MPLASASFLLAHAVSSAGAQYFSALSPSLLPSRLSFCFVPSLSLFPEVGVVKGRQRANLLTRCAKCSALVGCVVSSTGDFVGRGLPARLRSPFPLGVVCFCRCRDPCFVFLLAFARDSVCSLFLCRLFCRCMSVRCFCRTIR
jgi:hypothetical protein